MAIYDHTLLLLKMCMVDRLWEKETMKVKDCWNLLLPMSWLLVTHGFKKKFEHLVTYQPGDCKTQIDYILYKRSFRKMVSNVKVIVGEVCKAA